MDPLRGTIHLGLKLTETTLDRALEIVKLADTLLVASAVPPVREPERDEPVWPQEEQADLDALSATLRARKESGPRKSASAARKAPAKKSTPARKSTPAKKAPAKKAPAKKSAATGRSTATKKASVKKAPAKKTPAKKTPAEKPTNLVVLPDA